MGNIDQLITVDLIEFIKNNSTLQLSNHPFKKWENVKQYLHVRVRVRVRVLYPILPIES